MFLGERQGGWVDGEEREQERGRAARVQGDVPDKPILQDGPSCGGIYTALHGGVASSGDETGGGIKQTAATGVSRPAAQTGGRAGGCGVRERFGK